MQTLHHPYHLGQYIEGKQKKFWTGEFTCNQHYLYKSRMSGKSQPYVSVKLRQSPSSQVQWKQRPYTNTPSRAGRFQSRIWNTVSLQLTTGHRVSKERKRTPISCLGSSPHGTMCTPEQAAHRASMFPTTRR